MFVIIVRFTVFPCYSQQIRFSNIGPPITKTGNKKINMILEIKDEPIIIGRQGLDYFEPRESFV